jgi:hypothetical protein
VIFPIEPPLHHDYCGFALGFGVGATSTIIKKLCNHKQYTSLGFTRKTTRLLEAQRLKNGIFTL